MVGDLLDSLSTEPYGLVAFLRRTTIGNQTTGVSTATQCNAIANPNQLPVVGNNSEYIKTIKMICTPNGKINPKNTPIATLHILVLCAVTPPTIMPTTGVPIMYTITI